MVIESRQNEIVKTARALSLAKERRARGLHRIEGAKLVREAVASGQAVTDLFCEEGFDFPAPEGARVHTVTRGVLEALTDTATPQHVAAIVKTPDTAPPAHYPDGLVVVLDGVQDPGNAGTILRTADAFGAAAVLISPDCADPYSEKTLRASMGSAYHVRIVQGDAATELSRMLSDGFTAVCGRLDAAETLPPLSRRVALVIGSEGRGASEAVEALCTGYRLAMPGRAESLNASVAAGILLYEISKEMKL